MKKAHWKGVLKVKNKKKSRNGDLGIAEKGPENREASKNTANAQINEQLKACEKV